MHSVPTGRLQSVYVYTINYTNGRLHLCNVLFIDDHLFRYFPHRSLHVKVGSEVNHIFIQDDSLKQCQKLVACLLQDLTKY